MDVQMEESKLEQEGYVESSEDEQDKKDEEKEKSVSTITLSQQVSIPLRAVIVSECSHSESLTKIIFADDFEEIGKCETEYEGKKKDTVKLFLVKS